MEKLTIGVHVLAPTVQEVIDRIRLAEEAGVDAVWMTKGGAHFDPLAVFAAAATQTSRIKFGTSIVPTFPIHPMALAQSAVVVDQLAPGRLRLGVGPSHKPTMEGMWGIPFERPLEHLREYLTILKTLLTEGQVSFEGKRLTAKGQLPSKTQVTVMASALRKNGFRVCGELADGAISWVCPLPYLRDVAIPAIREGAERAGRTPPPLVAHIPVAVSEDADAVREAARRQIGFYPRVPFYSQMFQDAGFPEAKDGQMSDRMIDALVVHGSASEVQQRLREAADYGAGEVLAMPLFPANDPGAFERTVRALGELAQGR